MLIFRKFSPDLHTGEEPTPLGAPAPHASTPLGTFGPSIVVSTPYKNAGYAPGSWYSRYNIYVGQTVLFQDVI